MSEPEDPPGGEPRTVFAPKTPRAPDPAAGAQPADETVFAPRGGKPGSAAWSGDPTPGPEEAGAASAPFQPAAPVQAAAPRGPARIEIGMVLNDLFSIRRLIGRGGMGEVYEGVNVNDSEDRVAIKVILPNLAADPNMQAMFFKEARALRTLSHPAVVQYRVVAQEPDLGIFYIVTEFIDGPPLSEMLGRITPTLQDLRGLIRRLAEGLRAAHELGAVHRDMSPDNVLLPGGRLSSAKVIDFGIAKDLEPGNRTIIGEGFAGKLGYVAPEQFGDFGREIGPWTDVYSLGLVMLSFILGRNVDMGSTLVEAVDKRRAGPDLSAVPADLRPLLQGMLTADPALRLRSMDAVLAALDGAASPRPALHGPGAVEASRPRPKPRRGAGLLISVAVATLVVVLGGLGYILTRPPKAVVAPPTTRTVSAGQPAGPAAAPRPPDAASVRSAILAGLSTVPCSWLDLESFDQTPNGVTVTLKGVAGSTLDAQAAISRLVTASGAHASDLDFGQVDQVGPAVCSALDAFAAFRAPPSPAGGRLSTPQARYAMEIRNGKPQAQALVELRIRDPARDLSFFGMEAAGEIQNILPSRRDLIKAAANPGLEIAVKDDDTFSVPFYADAQGWNGALLLTGRGPFDVKLIEAPPAKRNGAWRARLLRAAQAGGWQADMVWFQAVKP